MTNEEDDAVVGGTDSAFASKLLTKRRGAGVKRKAIKRRRVGPEASQPVMSYRIVAW